MPFQSLFVPSDCLRNETASNFAQITTRVSDVQCSSFSIKSTCVRTIRRQQYLFNPIPSSASLFHSARQYTTSLRYS